MLLSFVPLAGLASDLRVTLGLDLLGWFTGWAAASAYVRLEPATWRWRLPFVIWLPLTTALKVAMLAWSQAG